MPCLCGWKSKTKKKLEGHLESSDLCQGQYSTPWYANLQLHPLYMTGYIYNAIIIFLYWLCFVSIELHPLLLIFNMYGTVEHRLTPKLNAVCSKVSESNTKFMDLPHDSDPLILVVTACLRYFLTSTAELFLANTMDFVGVPMKEWGGANMQWKPW